MPLLTKILEWSEKELTLWQRDAVRRLFVKQSMLDDIDYSELFLLLKSAHGLSTEKSITTVPLSRDHIPANRNGKEPVILKAIQDIKDVNRIAANQPLRFSAAGMTIIYGANGSGKSGYFRVIKSACRARDQAEPVHADATDPNSSTKIPEAIFSVTIGDTQKPFKWVYDKTSPEELTDIAVFDSHCARAYLTAEQDIAYLPYGLDVVEALANKIIPELNNRLLAEIDAINVDTLPYNHLVGETQVGKVISVLNYKTNSSQLKTLAVLTPEEMKQVDEIELALKEIDPKAKATQLKQAAQRMQNLSDRIVAVCKLFDEETLKELKEHFDSAKVAATTANVAAENFLSGDTLLPGTGEQVWKALYDAARTYSTEVAYPDKPFPYTASDAVCPLCQQPLRPAAERLKRFEEFIQQNSAKDAEEKKIIVKTDLDKI